MLWMFIFHLEYFFSCNIFWNIAEKKYFFLIFFSFFRNDLIIVISKKVFIMFNVVYSRNKFFENKVI
jgi:hypothetical protein